MPCGMFVSPPRWVRNEANLKNVLSNQLFGQIDASSFSSLEDNALLEQGIRQYQYWRKELQPSVSNNTVISFLGPKGLESCNILEVAKALQNICSVLNLIEVYQASNSKFFGFTFSDSAEVEKIISRFHYFMGLAVVFVSPPGINSHNFRLLWLPPVFPVEKVHALMSKYTSKYYLKKESVKTGDNLFTPSNNYSGTLSPPEGISLSSLPHLVRLPAPHRGCALLIVEGRSPLCLKCRQVGHLRKSCDYSRCSSCSQLHSPSTACGIVTYATLATRNIHKSSHKDWLDNTDDGHLTGNAPIYSADSASKIAATDSNILTNVNTEHEIASLDTSHTLISPVVDSVPIDVNLPLAAATSSFSDERVPSPPECNRPFTDLSTVLLESITKTPTSDIKCNTVHTLPSIDLSESNMDSSLSCDFKPSRSSSSSRRAPKRRQGRSLSPRRRCSDNRDTSADLTSFKLNIQSSKNPDYLSVDNNRSTLALRSEFVSYDVFSSTSEGDAATAVSSEHISLDVVGTPDLATVFVASAGDNSLVASTSSDCAKGDSASILFEEPPSDCSQLLRSNLGYSSSEITIIRGVCIQRKITMAVVRKLTTLRDYGYSIQDIMAFPSVIKTPEASLKKRLKLFAKIGGTRADLFEVYHSVN